MKMCTMIRERWSQCTESRWHPPWADRIPNRRRTLPEVRWNLRKRAQRVRIPERRRRLADRSQMRMLERRDGRRSGIARGRRRLLLLLRLRLVYYGALSFGTLLLGLSFRASLVGGRVCEGTGSFWTKNDDLAIEGGFPGHFLRVRLQLLYLPDQDLEISADDRAAGEELAEALVEEPCGSLGVASSAEVVRLGVVARMATRELAVEAMMARVGSVGVVGWWGASASWRALAEGIVSVGMISLSCFLIIW
jgi:hypothetical protein